MRQRLPLCALFIACGASSPSPVEPAHPEQVTLEPSAPIRGWPSARPFAIWPLYMGERTCHEPVPPSERAQVCTDGAARLLCVPSFEPGHEVRCYIVPQFGSFVFGLRRFERIDGPRVWFVQESSSATPANSLSSRSLAMAEETGDGLAILATLHLGETDTNNAGFVEDFHYRAEYDSFCMRVEEVRHECSQNSECARPMQESPAARDGEMPDNAGPPFTPVEGYWALQTDGTWRSGC